MPEHGVELQNRDPADLTLEVVAEAEQGDVLESLQPIGCPAGEKVESMRSMFRSPTFADSAMEQLHTPLVIVPATWEARPGAELNRRLRLGKVLGTGFMGAVYDVEKADGSPANRVMKVLKASADDAMRELLEREMVIGRLLYEALGKIDDQGSPTIPGYMLIQAAVRREVPGGPLLGIIIEKVNSVDVFKRISQFGSSKPVNIHYIRAMLSQTLKALKKGQDAIGFYHRDLHAANIMEHLSPESGPTSKALEAPGPNPAVQDGSIREVKKDQVKLSNQGWKYRTDAALDIWQEVEGCSADDLGIEFKIIDFGWAVAAAVDDEEVSELMKEQLPAAIGCGKCFCCYLVEISLGSTVGMDIGSLLGDSAVGPVVWWGSWYPFEKPETKDSASPVKTEASRTQSFARNATSPASSTADKGKKGFKGSKIPKLQFSTMMYHRIWRGSSDCWRLLASLAAILDNRLWHARDREAVLELEDLLFKSSGVHIRMRFTDKDDSNEYKSKKYGTAWQARQMMRMGRGWFNMAWAMAFPSDPGFSIDKALDHRFFSAKIPATAAKLMAQPQPNAGVDVSEIELQHR